VNILDLKDEEDEIPSRIREVREKRYEGWSLVREWAIAKGKEHRAHEPAHGGVAAGHTERGRAIINLGALWVSDRFTLVRLEVPAG